MGLLNRLRTLMSAQSHHALDQLENPALMAEQLVREIESELGQRREALVHSLVALDQLKALRSSAAKDHEKWQRQARTLLSQAKEDQARELMARALAAQQRRDRGAEEIARQQEAINSLRDDIAMLDNERHETLAQAKIIAATQRPGCAPAATGYTAMHDRRQRLSRYQNAAAPDFCVSTALKAAEHETQVDAPELDAAMQALRDDLTAEAAA